MDRRQLLFGAAARPSPGRAGAGEPLTPRERAVHLVTRLTFGPRPGDVERVLEMGEEAWLDEQLAGGPSDPELEQRLAAYPSLPLSARELYERYYGEVAGQSSDRFLALETSRRVPQRELLAATLERMVFARAQLAEVLVDFWRNHFNVSYTKDGEALLLLTEWDRSVLRQHALGKFGTLLSASAHHPAMLHYLDNASSRRPPLGEELAEIERRVREETGSQEAARAAADLALQRGLNENYARELLELHTLGVDRFYEQKDVVALAEILTGWTFEAGEKGPWTFRFRPDMHVLGSKRFLGQRVQGKVDQGQEEGESVLARLAEHKGTAEFVAEKLARHFVSDHPPAQLVAALAQTFKRSEGDVPSLVRDLVASDAFWAREHFRAKFRTPQEFAVAALRATAAEVSAWGGVLERLTSMGQPLYQCDDPTGWYDTAEAWLDPGVLAQRWLFARDLIEDRVEGVELRDEAFDDLGDDVPFAEWPERLAARFGALGLGSRTVLSIETAIADEPDALPGALRRRLLALILGSPEFQRQ
jgi:uncharacterized protein (DUF1800 family)